MSFRIFWNQFLRYLYYEVSDAFLSAQSKICWWAGHCWPVSKLVIESVYWTLQLKKRMRTRSRLRCIRCRRVASQTRRGQCLRWGLAVRRLTPFVPWSGWLDPERLRSWSFRDSQWCSWHRANLGPAAAERILLTRLIPWSNRSVFARNVQRQWAEYLLGWFMNEKRSPKSCEPRIEFGERPKISFSIQK